MAAARHCLRLDPESRLCVNLLRSWRLINASAEAAVGYAAEGEWLRAVDAADTAMRLSTEAWLHRIDV